MCLSVDLRLQGSIRNAHGECVVPKVAGYDILAWKVFRLDENGTLHSPFQFKAKWTLGQRKWARNMALMVSGAERYVWTDSTYRFKWQLHAGLHAFVTRLAANLLCQHLAAKYRRSDSDNYVVRPVCIPAGSKFYFGHNGHIASDCMRVYDSLEAALGGRLLAEGDRLLHRNITPPADEYLD